MKHKPKQISKMHPIRLFSILIAAGLGGFGLFFYFDGDPYKRNVAILFAISLFVPFAIYEAVPWIRKRFARKALYAIELIWAIIVVLNAEGAAGYYHMRVTYHYDDFLHFFVPLMAALGLGIAISIGLDAKKGYERRRAIIYSLASLLAILFIWEYYEYVADRAWGTYMSSQDGQPLDTVYDLVLGVLSLPVAGLVMHFRLGKFMRSLRRPKPNKRPL